MHRIIITLMLLFTILASCQDYGHIKPLGQLPETLEEVSGIVVLNDGKVAAINDSGNAPSVWIYQEDQLLVELEITNVDNHDWEDLTYDRENHVLYIGDFGNNDNERKNLKILKVDLNGIDLSQSQQLQAVEIPFHYEDQDKFPPKKKNRIYDCEAFIIKGNFFYLFTRNRSKDFNGKTTVYRLPINGSSKKAIKLAEIEICNDDKDCQVTGAAINTSGTIALLTSDKVFTISNYHADFKSFDIKRYDLEHYSQKEGLDYTSQNSLLIIDERNKSTGGMMYSFDY